MYHMLYLFIRRDLLSSQHLFEWPKHMVITWGLVLVSMADVEDFQSARQMSTSLQSDCTSKMILQEIRHEVLVMI
jgi:hypothetical protein